MVTMCLEVRVVGSLDLSETILKGSLEGGIIMSMMRVMISSIQSTLLACERARIQCSALALHCWIRAHMRMVI